MKNLDLVLIFLNGLILQKLKLNGKIRFLFQSMREKIRNKFDGTFFILSTKTI